LLLERALKHNQYEKLLEIASPLSPAWKNDLYSSISEFFRPYNIDKAIEAAKKIQNYESRKIRLSNLRRLKNGK
jgi:hypothetical protein